MNGEVLIVDEFTGRVLHGRRYNEGMHQAIEAKEGVEIQHENQTLATITLQNYFRLYDKLSGMTGTAQTEAAEFHQIYKLGVVPIPTNRPMVRADEPDLIYKTEEAKFEACVEDIAERHEEGQPVLVGTASVEKSERCRGCSAQRGPARGAQRQVPRSARPRSSPRPAARARSPWPPTWPAAAPTSCSAATPSSSPTPELRERGLSPVETPEDYEAAWPEALEKAKKATVAEEHDEVVELGGLYVLGTERHESRRIDNQLRGRSGPAGRPGRVPVLPVPGRRPDAACSTPRGSRR